MRMTRVLLLSASIVMATTMIAMPGVASADPDALAGPNANLTAPGGIVQTPDGGLWITDEVGGVCRLALGAQPHLVDSPWCGAVEPPENEEEAPEAGDEDALPVPPIVPVDGAGTATGPGSVGGLAFDPQTDNFYVSDRDSSGGGVWRLHFDRASGVIDGATQIVSTTDRVETLTLGPDAAGDGGRDVFFVTKRAGDLMRISDPAGQPGQPELVMSLGLLDVTSIAASDDALYLGDADGGVKRLSLTAPGAAPQAVPGLDGLIVSAVAVDPARDRLYAGTANADAAAPSPDLEDVVEVVDLSTGAHEPYEQGLTSVTALGVGSDGALVIADDPSLVSQFTVWQARLWRTAVQPMGKPQVQITARPAAISAAAGASVSYGSRDAASFECRLNDGAFEACPGSGSGVRSFAALPEGTHRFSVRAKDTLTGLYASVRFTLDRTAPNVTAIQPTNDYIEGGLAPRIRFSAYEDGISYACSVDDGPFTPCYSGNPVDDLTPGVHVLRVVGTDAAGNASDPNAASASVKITVLARWRPPTAEGSAPASAGASVASAPAAAAPAPAQAPVEVKPLLFPFTLRVKDSPSTTRRLRFGLSAPGGSAELRITVKNWRGRTVLTRALPVRPNARNRLDLSLTRAEQRRLRPGRYLVRAVLSTARGTEGNPQTHWLRVRARSR
jgi:hypothetical protein